MSKQMKSSPPGAIFSAPRVGPMRPCVSRTWLRVSWFFSPGAAASAAAKTIVVRITGYLISLKTEFGDAYYPQGGASRQTTFQAESEYHIYDRRSRKSRRRRPTSRQPADDVV